MGKQMTFKRMEIKLLVSDTMRDQLLSEMSDIMREDEHGPSTIYSLYLDTDDFLLANRSIRKPKYKEKLRVRSYNSIKDGGEIFLEVKKKCQSVTTKRRIVMDFADVSNAYGSIDCDKIKNALAHRDDQIAKELLYSFNRYEGLAPRALLTYDRIAFYDKDDYEFRVTFDKNIKYDDRHMDMRKDAIGRSLIDEKMNVMEVKTLGSLPFWFCELLSSYGIYKASYSKYALAYGDMLSREKILNFNYGDSMIHAESVAI